MSQQSYTAKELELIDLALDAVTGEREKVEKFHRARQNCAFERYARRNPEWREQLKRAHTERDAAGKRYWAIYEELCSVLGVDATDRLEEMLRRGEDPFA